MRIECVGTDAELASLAAEWAALWRRVPAATPFQSPAWLSAWWRQFGNGCPRILAARTDGELAGELAGILPLYELHEHCRKLLPIGIGLSDYIDMLVDPDCPEAGDRLVAAISDLSGWDECHLPDLMPGSPLALAAAPSGLAESRSSMVSCPVLSLPADPAMLDRVVPRKTLRDLRQAAARAAAAGGVAVEMPDLSRPEPVIEELFRLHEARWHARGEEGVCAEPAVRRFHHAAARALGEAGLLRLYRLRIADRLAAVYYGFNWRGRACAYLGAFDPDLPRFSPGAQILFHAIGEAIAEGCTEFHFLRGGEAYKYAWGAVDRWNMARTLRRR
jgi:CelD/BcsL family acetyltransferase involved in cellulose biosynthesis